MEWHVQESLYLESINIGRLETLHHNGKSLSTGICKYPVSGPVSVEELGLRGDVIVDSEHHGGPDQAIYAYSAEDYDWWAGETGRDYPPGLFGENLTIRGMPPDMNVGDRFLIGELVLEATAPRIPCNTFTARMQDSSTGHTFREAERPGVYFRVLNGGVIEAGDPVTYVANQSSKVSILELFRFNYALRHEAATLHHFLDAPLASRFRTKIESKLRALERVSG
jgi:MOSC domain-containing protein YiiM